MSLLANSPAPQVTPTYDGSGQAVHPDVIDFLTEYGIATWAGHRYWMAMTPYPNGNDFYENPSMLVSNDGQTWTVPSGITNPIVGPPVPYQASRYHLLDTDIVYDPDADCLYVYYVERDDTAVYVKRMRIGSNKSVTGPVLCITDNTTNLLVSPTVLRYSANEWVMYHCSRASGQLEIYHRTSTDGINWTPRALCNSVVQSNFAGHYPWHVTAKLNATRDAVELIVSTSTSATASSLGGILVLLDAPIDTPTTLHSPLPSPLLGVSTSGWDNSIMYRVGYVIEGDTRRIWYSARSSTNAWRVGYVQGDFVLAGYADQPTPALNATALSGVISLAWDGTGEWHVERREEVD